MRATNSTPKSCYTSSVILGLGVIPLRRGEFIVLLSSGVAAWALGSRAEEAERMRRIGVLVGTYAQIDREGQDRIAVFLDTFRKLGWSDARNVRIDYLGRRRCRPFKDPCGRIGPFRAGCDRCRE